MFDIEITKLVEVEPKALIWNLKMTGWPYNLDAKFEFCKRLYKILVWGKNLLQLEWAKLATGT